MSNFTAAPRSMVPVPSKASKPHKAGNTTMALSSSAGGFNNGGQSSLKMSKSTDMIFSKNY
jgi:hypothetical protein